MAVQFKNDDLQKTGGYPAFGEQINKAISDAVNKATEGIKSAVNDANAQPEEDDGGKKRGYVAPQTTPATSSPAPNYDRTVPSVFGDTVDPELQAQYQNRMAELEALKGQAPTYDSRYDEQIQRLYEQIVGRDKFRYDQKTDPLYQKYVQDYTTQGKMAMRDTMGKAAGLTGGYGSSYAQAVGQQQYDQYLQRLADILPETYGMALKAWQAEGDQLNEKMGTTRSLEQSDYARYLDALSQYNTDLDRAQTDADTWYERMTDAERQNYARQLDQYQLQKEYYNRLMGLISAGYTPSREDYAAAGLSEAQGAALRAQYAPAPASSSSGGGGGRRKKKEEVSENELMKEYIRGLAGAVGGTAVNTAKKISKK